MKTRPIVPIIAILAGFLLTNTAEGGKLSKEVARKTPFLTLMPQSLESSNSPIDPFINSSLPNPPKKEYSGPLFQLRHDYPSQLPPPVSFPWEEVTGNGPITPKNALAYVKALKKYVSSDMKKLLFHYDQWNPLAESWWESIWLGTEREPIHGLYVGSGFPAGTLPDQNLNLTTYVFTLYDERAAVTLGNIWGSNYEGAFSPNLTNPGAQFAEGSVIIKFAFVTSCGADWAPMKGAAVWQAYTPLNESNGSGNNPSQSSCPNNGSDGSPTNPALTNLYLMQFDIIVKDSRAAPETGWVFSTLVYDKDAEGEDAWDKMIPLGATWGNNPDVINTSPEALTPPVAISSKLTQNYINLNAPAYATATLGWDGRLSGPNDGAVVTPAWAGGKYYPKGLASVGCLGCHSNAQYKQKSFLLPTTTYPPTTPNVPGSSASALLLYEPGSQGWMKWFQNRSGAEPMDPGPNQIGLDYDMVTAFKAIPLWQAAMKSMQKEDILLLKKKSGQE